MNAKRQVSIVKFAHTLFILGVLIIAACSNEPGGVGGFDCSQKSMSLADLEEYQSADALISAYCSCSFQAASSAKSASSQRQAELSESDSSSDDLENHERKASIAAANASKIVRILVREYGAEPPKCNETMPAG